MSPTKYPIVIHLDVSEGYAREILTREKRIEVQLIVSPWDEIGPGDTLVFLNGQQKIRAYVTAARFYTGASPLVELLHTEPLHDILPAITDRSSAYILYLALLGGEDKIRNNGLVAVEFSITSPAPC